MRLSVSEARADAPVINIVPATTASVEGNIIFILILSVVLVAYLFFNAGYILADGPVSRYGV